MRFAFTKCHGSGNDFPLIDARDIALDDMDWAHVARALADRDGPVGGDGLLLLVAGDGEHAFGMRMFNSDGSEAETCLNGLRCVARAGFEALNLDAAKVRLKTSSAEVAREAELAPGVVTVRTIVGPASTIVSAVLPSTGGDTVSEVTVSGSGANESAEPSSRASFATSVSARGPRFRRSRNAAPALPRPQSCPASRSRRWSRSACRSC